MQVPLQLSEQLVFLAMPFSLGLTGAKINKIWIGQGDEVKIVYFYTKFVEIRCKLNFLTFAAQNR